MNVLRYKKEMAIFTGCLVMAHGLHGVSVNPYLLEIISGLSLIIATLWVAYAEKKELKKIERNLAEQNVDNRKLCDIVIEELSKYSGNEVYKAPWALDSTGVQYPLYFAELGAKWQKEKKPASKVEPSAFKDMLLELFQRFRWYCKDETQTNGDIIEYVDAHIQELIDTIQKPAWSEEDKDKYEAIVAILRKLYNGTNPEEKKYYNGLINWLKSLKDRYTWKPSDEQIYWIKWVAHSLPDTEKANEAEAVLEELLEQLKKIREE